MCQSFFTGLCVSLLSLNLWLQLKSNFSVKATGESYSNLIQCDSTEFNNHITSGMSPDCIVVDTYIRLAFWYQLWLLVTHLVANNCAEFWVGQTDLSSFEFYCSILKVLFHSINLYLGDKYFGVLSRLRLMILSDLDSKLCPWAHLHLQCVPGGQYQTQFESWLCNEPLSL